MHVDLSGAFYSGESFLRVKASRRFWTGESSVNPDAVRAFSLYFSSDILAWLSLLLNSTLFSSFLMVLAVSFLLGIAMKPKKDGR